MLGIWNVKLTFSQARWTKSTVKGEKQWLEVSHIEIDIDKMLNNYENCSSSWLAFDELASSVFYISNYIYYIVRYICRHIYLIKHFQAVQNYINKKANFSHSHSFSFSLPTSFSTKTTIVRLHILLNICHGYTNVFLCIWIDNRMKSRNYVNLDMWLSDGSLFFVSPILEWGYIQLSSTRWGIGRGRRDK